MAQVTFVENLVVGKNKLFTYFANSKHAFNLKLICYDLTLRVDRHHSSLSDTGSS